MARPSLAGPLSFLKPLLAAATLAFAIASPLLAAGRATAVPTDGLNQTLPAPPAPPSALLPLTRSFKNTLSTGQLRLLYPVRTLAISLLSTQTLYNGAPGANGANNTLVLYDSTGDWGWLGEAYAVQAGNIVSHGSKYVMHPAATYVAGELAGYTGLVYIGSTYDEQLPTALLDDVLATAKPVLWMNHNIWQLSARAGDFATRYGWSPQFFDFSNTPTVTYKGIALQRNALAAPAGLLQTLVIDPAKAQVLATATSDTGVVSNWATRGGNLTYIGEIPFSYSGMTDRYLAAVDLIGQVSNPAMLSRKRALVRIEDVGPDADPAELRAIADYLYSKKVPFSVAVYSLYKDPKGVYNNGVPVSLPLRQARNVISALKYMQSRGGTLLMHGYTHQYSNVANPYSGVSADDFEFYRAHISADNYVVYDSPVAEDSSSWALGRISLARSEFTASGITPPTIFEAPHYAASAIDYQVFQQQFGTRYDRGLYAANWCPGGNCGTGTPDYTRIYGQFFPYLVRDIFGTVVLPESLGNVELEEFNHNPPRYPADILASARANTVIKDSVQSFFFHPYLSISNLKTIVEGLQAMGYQFVTPATVKQG